MPIDASQRPMLRNLSIAHHFFPTKGPIEFPCFGSQGKSTSAVPCLDHEANPWRGFLDKNKPRMKWTASSNMIQISVVIVVIVIVIVIVVVVVVVVVVVIIIIIIIIINLCYKFCKITVNQIASNHNTSMSTIRFHDEIYHNLYLRSPSKPYFLALEISFGTGLLGLSKSVMRGCMSRPSWNMGTIPAHGRSKMWLGNSGSSSEIRLIYAMVI